jgi:signal transduction histidine kinase
MLTNLNFRTRLGTMITSSLVVSAAAALIALALTAFGAPTAAAIVGVVALLAVAACAVIAAGEVGETTELVDQVVASAEELTTNRLPRLTTGVLDNDDLEGFEPFPGSSNEGLGRVVTALNSVQTDTRNLVLQQRSQVREGVSNLVVNLVRRNQGLLERQLDHIDRLESSEEDPDRLEDLYGVDHLASRMRRNAESLLVLAGLDPQRRKGEPISINDLMRVAMGEIEGYQNVRITRVDDGEVSAQSALDIAHLLSELLENATQFSPPTANVELSGSAQSDGTYLIAIADHGIGMSNEQLAEYNDLLVDPPELSLGLGRSLGFLVVARLAKRLGLTVELASTPNSAGVTALVLVPQELLNGQQPVSQTTLTAPEDTRGSAEGSAPAAAYAAPPAQTAPASPAAPAEPAAAGGGDGIAAAKPPFDDEPAWDPPTVPERGSGGLGTTGETDGDDSEAKPVQSEALAKLLGVPATDDETEAPASAEMPQRLEDAIPSGESFDAGVAGLLGDDEHEPIPAADGSPTMPAQRTSKGLTKRDRSRSRAPVSEGRHIPDSATSATASSRDPEEIRNMLARYRKAREGTNPDETPERGDAQ